MLTGEVLYTVIQCLCLRFITILFSFDSICKQGDGNDYFDTVINKIISFPPQWNANTADFIRSVSGCIE